MAQKRKENKAILIKRNESNNNNEKKKIKKRNKLIYFNGIFKFIILIEMFTKILLQDNLNIIYSNFSNITLIVKGKGFKNIFYQSFNFYPNETYINGVLQTKISYTYDFTEINNTVVLIWYNNINSCLNMFNGCSHIIKIDLSNFNSSKVINMGYMFYNCENLASLDLSHFETSQVEDMNNMFYRCKGLSSLDLSNFDTSKVVSMNSMFNGCNKLITLNISNFITSRVKDMSNMFNGCNLLASLDVSSFDTSKVNKMEYMFAGYKSSIPLNLSNFNTSEVTSMNGMFKECSSFTSLDLSFFQTSKVKDMSAMFWGCNSLISLNLSNFDTSSVTIMGSMFRDCKSLILLDLSHFNTSQVNYMSYMFENCNSLVSLNLSNFDTSQTNSMDNIFYQCNNLEYINLEKFNDVKLNSYSSMFSGVKNNIVICINKNNNNKIIEHLQIFKLCYKIDCSSDWKLNQVKLINHTNNCVHNNINKFIKYNYEYNGKYYEYCINGNLMNRNISGICKCDEEKCLKCPNETFVENLCNGCRIDNGFYPIENDNISFIENYFKCYKEPEGYYLAQNNSVYKKCYETCEICNNDGDYMNHNCLKCSINYPYQINSTNDSNSFNCYKNCSFYHYFDEQNIFHCTINSSCPAEYPYLIIDKSECTKEDITKMQIYFENCFKYIKNRNLTNDSFIKGRTKSEEINYYNLILESIENCFTSENYDKSNLNNGEEEVIITEKINITLTTTKIKNNKLNNVNITIGLGQCEFLLKKYYNISINEPIYIKLINVFQEGMKIPKTEYDVYYNISGTNLKKLNLSICTDNKIYLVIPMNISENIDILNSSSDYYKDICYITPNNNKLDINLKDRRKEFIDENKTVCQDYCDFSEYDYIKKEVKCTCEIRKSSKYFTDMNIDKSKLAKKYSDKKNIFNFQLLHCYKSLFSKTRIFLNIGFIIFSLINITHIVNIFIFYLKNIYIINNNLNDISSIEKKGDIFKINEEFNKKNNTNNNKYKKKRRSIKNISVSKRKILSNANTNDNNNNIIIFNNDNIIRNMPEIESRRKIIDSSIKSTDKIDDLQSLNENELNLLTYDKALENDKRTFLEYYISLIKTKHNLVYLFYNKKDYNSKIIKFDLLFFGFSFYYAINTAFYSNEIIHKVYLDKGSYNLKYQFPLIIYSSFISFAFNIIFKILALSSDIILNFKQTHSINDIKIKVKKLKKKILIKFILYFIISVILLIFFWYYVSMFGAVYKNNQYHLLYNVLISFYLSIFYPFGLYLICGIIRILSLSNTKKERKCLYNFSKVLQKC